ncbi:hypothetical protein OGAPHI_004978 [Ogataea philodendri]|uniref:Uncharacterized protein n=1 Tax=Ogataea philodendri TaxID=1378263 RepID=A0A9P8P1R9_9ASCO|nr:uncharacterized protein OGAPHI_004978 [Ogataea philodendri]KAH3663577.1 hypothetical protein OGAPHI_004978 [Ogataea philodendri]
MPRDPKEPFHDVNAPGFKVYIYTLENLLVRLLRERIRWSDLLDRKTGKPVSNVHTGSQIFVLDQSCNKTCSKCISSPVSVGDFRSLQGVDRILLDGISTIVLLNDQSRVGTLGENNGSCSLGVCLGGISNLLGDCNQVLGVQSVGFSVGCSFGFVTDDVINVRKDLEQWLFEELRNERSREVEQQRLVFFSSVFTEQLDGLWGNSQVEASDVEKLCVFHMLPVFRFFQVGRFEVVGGSQVGDQGSVRAVDQGSALTGGD